MDTPMLQVGKAGEKKATHHAARKCQNLDEDEEFILYYISIPNT